MSVIKDSSRSVRQSARPHRSHHVGKWVENLEKSDVTKLWADLHRVVCYHPLVRASRNAGLLVEDDSRNAYKDLTQELFVVLLSKERFQHYLTSGMTNTEIELEIGQIELTNLLTAELRKRYPESYRLARRISTIVQTSPNFRRFDNSSSGNGEQTVSHRRLAQRVYGLSYWSDGKPQREQAGLETRVANVPVRYRDNRKVGCTGDAQVVINNADLEDLIINVLEALDAPVDIRSLRSLVMSRLPVMDIYLVPISGSDDESENLAFEPIDLQENPEQNLLAREAERTAAGSVEQFLANLSLAVRGKSKQYNRILGVLWHCYLSAEGGTQLEVAANLGVSDSLVSEYRRRIETQLQELAFTEVEQARQFEQALRTRISEIINSPAQLPV
ncbi:MAG: hypothetical protein ABI954_01145 [Pyrinomonadaceae bacterium]